MNGFIKTLIGDVQNVAVVAALLGITAAVFDNFMIKVAFDSFCTLDDVGIKGRKYEMTNWASAAISQSAIPIGFDISQMLGEGGLFRTDRSIETFLDLFSPIAPDIVSNQRDRWYVCNTFQTLHFKRYI